MFLEPAYQRAARQAERARGLGLIAARRGQGANQVLTFVPVALITLIADAIGTLQSSTVAVRVFPGQSKAPINSLDQLDRQVGNADVVSLSDHDIRWNDGYFYIIIYTGGDRNVFQQKMRKPI